MNAARRGAATAACRRSCRTRCSALCPVLCLPPPAGFLALLAQDGPMGSGSPGEQGRPASRGTATRQTHHAGSSAAECACWNHDGAPCDILSRWKPTSGGERKEQRGKKTAFARQQSLNVPWERSRRITSYSSTTRLCQYMLVAFRNAWLYSITSGQSVPCESPPARKCSSGRSTSMALAV